MWLPCAATRLASCVRAGFNWSTRQRRPHPWAVGRIRRAGRLAHGRISELERRQVGNSRNIGKLPSSDGLGKPRAKERRRSGLAAPAASRATAAARCGARRPPTTSPIISRRSAKAAACPSTPTLPQSMPPARCTTCVVSQIVLTRRGPDFLNCSDAGLVGGRMNPGHGDRPSK